MMRVGGSYTHHKKRTRQGTTAMATESIPALKSIMFTPSRSRHRGEEKGRGDFEFAHWLADEAEANEDFFGTVKFPVPLMSAEGILILAQAQEEEFALAGSVPEQAYHHAAEIMPEDKNQLSFDFFAPQLHTGDMLDEDI
jgi:hypothetical protein